MTRRLSSFVVRAAIVTFMSFAVAFGFLAGATSPAAHYNPHNVAIGVASLFGAACGAMGILIARIRRMKAELQANWKRVSTRRPTGTGKFARPSDLTQAQDDVIVRRDADCAINYVNDAYCALAGSAAAKTWLPAPSRCR